MCFSTSHVLPHVSQESYDKFSHAHVLMHCSQLMCAFVFSIYYVLKSFRYMSFFSHVANAQASVCICTFGSKCVANRLSKCVTTILLAGSQAMNPMELLRNLMVS